MPILDLPDYGIIDAHMHPYLAEHRNFPFAVPETYEEFFAEQRRAGIVLSCGAFNIYNDGTDFEVIRECNRRALAAHEAFPKEFLPGVNVHPNFPEESCAEVQKFYDLGFRWVGEIAAYVMNYSNYYCPGLLPVMELAQDRDMVLCIHPSNLEDEEKILKNFPRLKLLVAHPGFPDIMKNYTLAQKYPNLYFDISGGGLARWGMLKKGVEMLGPERILFGSDFPVIASGMYVSAVLFEHISESERKMIFRENFLRLYGLDAEKFK